MNKKFEIVVGLSSGTLEEIEYTIDKFSEKLFSIGLFYTEKNEYGKNIYLPFASLFLTIVMITI